MTERMTPGRLRAAVCQILLEHVGRADLWGADGPGPAAAAHLAAIDDVSPRERLMTLAAWEVWEGVGRLDTAELLRVDPAGARLFATYLAAASYGHVAVNGWLAVRRQTPP